MLDRVKSHSKLKAAIMLRAALQNFLVHQNLSLFTVTFGEKLLTLAKCAATVFNLAITT